MEIKQFVLGDLRSNCYILIKDRKCVVIDPGYKSPEVITFLQTHQLRPLAIYITHGHYDHIGGVNALKSLFDCPVYAPKKDAMFFKVGIYNKLGFDVHVDHWVLSGDTFDWLDQMFTVLETPGHSPGGTVLTTDHMMFSGDTLFYQSIGRTDLLLSSSQDIYQSIKKLYQAFDDETIVYPGHGRPTSIGHEKTHNPFVRA
ncbi:MAG: MBL fold metallo-hydrolase [Acholeplasmataceae bacterium]